MVVVAAAGAGEAVFVESEDDESEDFSAAGLLLDEPSDEDFFA